MDLLEQPLKSASIGDISSRKGVNGNLCRVGVLCDRDREMMLEFSKGCIRRLNNHLSFRLFLSLLQHFFDANVAKEIEKNRLVIAHAAAGFGDQRNRADIDIDRLFEMTKDVDKEFMSKFYHPLFSMEIRYEDFGEIRKKRIVSFVDMVFDLLCNWQEAVPFTDVVKRTFAERSYREVLREVLHLYNLETRMLSKSLTFHGPAGRVKDLFADKLFSVMEKTAEDIAAEYTRKVYNDKSAFAGPL